MDRTVLWHATERATARKKKLLFVVNDPAFFLSHRIGIAKSALQRGYEVLLAAPPGRGTEQIESLGITWLPVSLSRWGTNPVREFFSLLQLIKLYRRVRPDVVHHVTIKPVLYGSLAAQISGVPRVINAISGFGYVFVRRGLLATIRKGLVHLMYKIVMRNPRQKTIFQNSDDYQYFLSNILNRAERYSIIRGAGINLKKFHVLPLPKNNIPVVMFVGRLLEDKGIREFVKAAQLLKASGNRARFVVIGDRVEGNPSSISEQVLFEWIDEGSVEFWGFRDNVRSCMQQADVVCLPSYREGLPRVLLEAASCARPLVATDVPGCREIVKDGFNGLLVKARSTHALKDALSVLIADPQLRSEMARKSRLYVENGNFSDFHVTNQTLALYEEA